MIRIVSPFPVLLGVYATIRTVPNPDRPNRRNRSSPAECNKSRPSIAFGSANTVDASSKETPCFVRLTEAFFGSHSNTITYIHYMLTIPLIRGLTPTPLGRPVQPELACVSRSSLPITLVSLPCPSNNRCSRAASREAICRLESAGGSTAPAANLERFRVEKSRKEGFEAPVTR